MSNTTLVIGAGVDKVEGINMPLASELIPEIAYFSEEEGKTIENIIRSFLPNLRFSFNRFIKEAIDLINQADDKQIYSIVQKLEQVINNNSCEEKDKVPVCVNRKDKVLSIEELKAIIAR